MTGSLRDSQKPLFIRAKREYSNKKPEYLVYQEAGMDAACRVVSDVAGAR
jgi:hypothetical protein